MSVPAHLDAVVADHYDDRVDDERLIRRSSLFDLPGRPRPGEEEAERESL